MLSDLKHHLCHLIFLIRHPNLRVEETRGHSHCQTVCGCFMALAIAFYLIRDSFTTSNATVYECNNVYRAQGVIVLPSKVTEQKGQKSMLHRQNPNAVECHCCFLEITGVHTVCCAVLVWLNAPTRSVSVRGFRLMCLTVTFGFSCVPILCTHS